MPDHEQRQRTRRFLGLFRDRLVLVSAFSVIVAISLAVMHVARLRSQLVESSALESARLYTDALAEFRSLYTSEVVDRLRPVGVTVTHDYHDTDGAIPLPATMSMMLGERIGDHRSGAEAHLYSPYPFPWREKAGGLRDDFAKEAWSHLSENSDEPFYRFEVVEGRAALRYATADRMRAGCVSCHNAHPDTPRTDWKEGDLRGVLEIVAPLDGFVADTRTQLTGLFVGLLIAASVGVVSIGLVVGRALRRSRESQREVEERTAGLRCANELLEQEIIERKALESQLIHAQKLESIGQLAAGIAHEINTPTQYVGDNTRFIRDSIADLMKLIDQFGSLLASAKECGVNEEQLAKLESAVEEVDLAFIKEEIPKAIKQTLDGLDRVAEIVRAMKDFSHPGNEEKTPTDLNEAIESTITVCRNRWKYVAELETDFQDDLPPVPCLVGEFNQVILNMVVNAADAIGAIAGDGAEGKGRITVSTRQDGEHVEIRVGDTGGGVPEEIRRYVFDPFFTTKEVGEGTGQGLAISHDVIVTKHGGTIDLEVEPGVGSTFIIRIPMVAEPLIKK